MSHIVIAVTSPLTATLLLKGQLRYLREANWRVTLLCGLGEDVEQFAAEQGVELITVSMSRQPSPLQDFRAIKAIYLALRKLRPDIISYGTPKASLLCSIAAYLTGIPSRIYVMRGLRAEGLQGIRKFVALILERLTASLSTEVFCVSPSLMLSAVQSGAISQLKAKVIGRGGSNGVDVSHFQSSPQVAELAKQLRSRLEIPTESLVIGFIGRMVRDKGIQELVQAFERISLKIDCFLLLVGSREENNDLSQACWERIEKNPRIQWLGPQSDLPCIYEAMDVFVLPSYREGLPNVVLEASAMERPVVVSCVTGAKDAVLDGETGKLFELGSQDSLVNTIQEYLREPEIRLTQGQAGRKFVLSHFSNQAVWNAYEQAYRNATETRRN